MARQPKALKLQRLAELRSKKPFRDSRLERARDALGQAHWRCLDRDVTDEIRQMRAALIESGATLADVDTTEKEVAEILALGKKKQKPQEEYNETAHRYWKTVLRVIHERSKRAGNTLKCFLKMLERSGVKLTDIGLTQQDVTDAQERIQKNLEPKRGRKGGKEPRAN